MFICSTKCRVANWVFVRRPRRGEGLRLGVVLERVELGTLSTTTAFPSLVNQVCTDYAVTLRLFGLVTVQ